MKKKRYEPPTLIRVDTAAEALELMLRLAPALADAGHLMESLGALPSWTSQRFYEETCIGVEALWDAVDQVTARGIELGAWTE